MELYISIIGALVAIGVAILGAIFTNKNNINLQLRKLKEDNYTSFIDSLQSLSLGNYKQEILNSYAISRNKLLLIADVEVITCLLEFEANVIGKDPKIFDEYFTLLCKSMRKDLNVKNKHLPTLSIKQITFNKSIHSKQN